MIQRYAYKLLMSHYSMICSILAGVVVLLLLVIVKRFIAKKIVLYGIAEVAGAVLFLGLCAVLPELSVTFMSTILAGMYAISVYDIVEQSAKGFHKVFIDLLIFCVIALTNYVVCLIGGMHHQFCITIRVFIALRTCFAFYGSIFKQEKMEE